MPVAADARHRLADHAGEGGVRLALDLGDARHRQAGGIDAVQTRRHQQITLLQVGRGGHEAQVQRAGAGAAKGHAAQAVADDLHGNRLVLVGQQRHLRFEQRHARHLPDHAPVVDHRVAGAHAVPGASVDDDALGVRITRLVEDFRRHGRHGGVLLQVEQRAQVAVLGLQLAGAQRLLGLGDGRLAQGAVVGGEPGGRLRVVQQRPGGIARNQHHALDRIQHHRHHLPDHAEHRQARVDHQQGQRKRNQGDQPRCRGRALLEEGRRGVVHNPDASD